MAVHPSEHHDCFTKDEYDELFDKLVAVREARDGYAASMHGLRTQLAEARLRVEELTQEGKTAVHRATTELAGQLDRRTAALGNAQRIIVERDERIRELNRELAAEAARLSDMKKAYTEKLHELHEARGAARENWECFEESQRQRAALVEDNTKQRDSNAKLRAKLELLTGEGSAYATGYQHGGEAVSLAFDFVKREELTAVERERARLQAQCEYLAGVTQEAYESIAAWRAQANDDASKWIEAAERIGAVEAERDEQIQRYNDVAQRAEDAIKKAEAERDRLASLVSRMMTTAHVCTDDCKPNAHIAFVGRHVLDATRRELDSAHEMNAELSGHYRDLAGERAQLTAERDELRSKLVAALEQWEESETQRAAVQTQRDDVVALMQSTYQALTHMTAVLAEKGENL